MSIKLIKLAPWSLFFSFIILVVFGSLLFMLPFMVNGDGLNFIDAIFTSSSALCSLGELPYKFEKLSSVGKVFISIFIQIGGIGILTTILLFIFFIARKSARLNIRTISFFDHSSEHNTKKFLKFIILMTFIFEFFGAIFYKLTSFFLNLEIPWSDAFFYSINIFCNAGFIGLNSKLFFMSEIPEIYCINIFLLIGGGFGFFILFEIFYKKIFKLEKGSLTITTKSAIYMYSITTFVGWIFYAIQYENKFSFLSLSRSLFAACSLKSLGVFPYSVFVSQGIMIFTSFYGLIGTAPLGTGTGLKTSVATVFISSLKTFFLGTCNVIVFCKIIPWQLVARCYGIMFYIISFSISMAYVLQHFFEIVYDYIEIYCDLLSVIIGNGFAWNNLATFNNETKLVLIFSMIFGKMCIFLLGFSSIKKEQNVKILNKDSLALF
jgi:trk system potassium uptake protein TrkH